MSTSQSSTGKMTNFRWIICAMLFFATTVNYLDRQVLSLTWKDFIAPEFHWTDSNYGDIAAIFSLVYAIANLFAGRFIDWMGTKKGYLWAIAVWSLGACMHALCGWATEQTLGIHNAGEMISATGAVASTIAITSVYYFIAARIVLGIGEAGNFPAAIKVTAEYFPKKDRAYSTSIFNAGATIGALAAPVTIPTLARYFQNIGIGNGWEWHLLSLADWDLSGWDAGCSFTKNRQPTHASIQQNLNTSNKTITTKTRQPNNRQAPMNSTIRKSLSGLVSNTLKHGPYSLASS